MSNICFFFVYLCQLLWKYHNCSHKFISYMHLLAGFNFTVIHQTPQKLSFLFWKLELDHCFVGSSTYLIAPLISSLERPILILTIRLNTHRDQFNSMFATVSVYTDSVFVLCMSFNIQCKHLLFPQILENVIYNRSSSVSINIVYFFVKKT